MSTRKTRESDTKGFERMQREAGGVIPSMLNDGDRIMVDTKDYMYEIAVLKGETPTPKYALTTGSEACLKVGNILTGVNTRSRKLWYDMEDWVGKDNPLVFLFENGTNILTGDVVQAIVLGTAKDGSKYTYEVWG